MIRLVIILFASGLFLTGYLVNVTKADSLSDDEATIAANIKALHSEKSEFRKAAAKALRQIIAKYQSGTPDIRRKDSGEAYWTEKVNHIVPGMSETEVKMILQPFPESPESSGVGSGDSHIGSYRLDYNWIVTIQYRNPDKVIEVPELVKREMLVSVPPPKNYTGEWIVWYVNGQKGLQVKYDDGKFNGLLTRFHDNGQKSYEQHYSNHEANGSDKGWYPDGKLMYTGQYRSDKPDGQWIHYYPNGPKSAEMNYKNGKFDGLLAGWYESGQIRFVMNYVNGVQNGMEAAWSEQGVLQYKRECKNGKVVP